MKVWFTVQIEAGTRKELRKLARKRGMKMGPLADALLSEGIYLAAGSAQDLPNIRGIKEAIVTR